MRPPAITYLVKNLQQALRVELDRALAEVGLTLPKQALLATLTRMPGASNAELARAAFVSPQSMNEVLGALARAGWIERTPDAANARILRTALTPAGLRMLARGGVATAAVEARLVSALGAGEEAVLRDLLQRCAQGLAAPPPATGSRRGRTSTG